ncbi:hypothetical protein K5Y32_23075 [Pantoea sp. DY-15]|uniref:hypothetical protein n=1 Tax=Pantoea sp. DY-15 TaxID=2871489 RepID=UPI001C98B65F|nr:hypothetical protein [Pantoea sp. DY-15]MBY4890811.1 hypothetical protein [Pantoea sp. DY-15]
MPVKQPEKPVLVRTYDHFAMVYFLGFVATGYAAGHEVINAIATGFETKAVLLASRMTRQADFQRIDKQP